MILRREKVQDSPTNHFFADIWFLSGDGVAHEHTSAVTKTHVQTSTHGLEEVAAPAGHTRKRKQTQTHSYTQKHTQAIYWL